MDNCVPGHDIPRPEWVGWSNDKRECLTNDTKEQKPENVPAAPAELPVQKPCSCTCTCNCWKRAIIFFLILIMLILSYFLWKKWKKD